MGNKKVAPKQTPAKLNGDETPDDLTTTMSDTIQHRQLPLAGKVNITGRLDR